MLVGRLVLILLTHLIGCGRSWLYPCRQISWGIYTVNKKCVLNDVVIKNHTLLYKIFFPPVDLEIDSGFIPDFNKAVASRLSAKTIQLSVQFCGVESVFIRDTLEKVTLNYNIISEVHFDSAKDLKLWALHMRSNHLRDVSFVQNITSLVILNLASNLISSVSWNTFKNLKSLATLELGRNLIKTLDGGDFQLPNLKRLLLAENRLSNFDLINSNMNKVEMLNISSNQMMSLNLFNFEKTFPALQTLDIGNNPWNCGRRQRIEDWMFLKGVTNYRSNTSRDDNDVVCIDDRRQTIALTVPDGTDRFRDSFQRLQNFYYDQLSEHDANHRLARAKARHTRLQYDLGLLNNSVHTTGQKINHLFQIYNLRSSHNMQRAVE